MPEAAFEHEGDGFWVSRKPVEPAELVKLGDLIERHAAAALELRFVTSIWPRWQQVRQSTLEFSGIRLRKAAPVK